MWFCIKKHVFALCHNKFRSGLGIPQDDPQFVPMETLLEAREITNKEVLATVKADRHAAALYEAAVNDAMDGRMTWPQDVHEVSDLAQRWVRGIIMARSKCLLCTGVSR